VTLAAAAGGNIAPAAASIDGRALSFPRMDPVTVALLCAVAFATAALSAVVGLAGGTVLLATMLLFFEPAAAIPLHGVIQLVSNGTRTVVQGRHVAWSVVGWYSLFLLPLALAGARVALAMPAALGTTLIGVFVLVATLRPEWLRIRPAGAGGEARRFAVLGGIAGFLGSLVGAVGPLVAPFFPHLGLSRRGVVGTAAACQGAGHLAKIAAFGWVGFSYREHLGLLVAMSMLVIAGAAAGSRLLDRVDEVLFTRLYRTVLVLVALRLVSSAAWMGDVAATAAPTP